MRNKIYINLSDSKWFSAGHYGLRDLFQVSRVTVCPQDV